MHGIGLHEPFSVLGSPHLELGHHDGTGSYTFHHLRFAATAFVWSRITRSIGFFWYLGFPFSLVNTAGFMVGEQTGKRRSAAALLVYLAVFALTSCYVLWSVAILDTITHWLDWERGFVRVAGLAVMVGGYLSQLVVVVLRGGQTPPGPSSDSAGEASRLVARWATDTPDRIAFIVHFIAVLLTITFILWFRPFQRDQDILLAGAFWQLLIVVGIPLLLLTATWLFRRAATNQLRAEAAAIATCGAALAVGHLYLSSFRNALGWLLIYLDGIGLPFIDPANDLDPEPFVLTLPKRLWAPDLVAPAIIGAIFVGALVIMPVLISYRLLSRSARKRKIERNYPGVQRQRIRQLLGSPPWWRPRLATMTPILFALSMVLILVIGALGWVVFASSALESEQAPVGPILILIHTAAAASFLALLAFTRKGVRERASRLFDLAGFWPRRYHPLAGEPYGPRVVQDLCDQLRVSSQLGKVALVGHSQGSVLAFEAAAELVARGEASLGLITCGSPIHRLYSYFFPSWFGESDFAKVATTTHWTNFHRDTDPIAGEIPSAEKNIPLLDEGNPTTGKLWEHSGYWTNEQVIARVDEILGSSRPRP